MAENRWFIKLTNQLLYGTDTYDTAPTTNRLNPDLLSISTKDGTVVFPQATFVYMSVVATGKEHPVEKPV